MKNIFMKAVLLILLMLSGIIIHAQSFDWAINMGGSGSDQGHGIAVDGSGNVYVAGHFNSDTANFNPGGSGGMLTTEGGSDVFLAKYDAGGSFLWAKDMGGSITDQGWGVAVDDSGNVYVTGYFQSATADFNPGGSGGTLTAAGGSDGFLAKYNAGGDFLWVKDIGGSGNDYAQGVAVDSNGNVCVTGRFNSDTANFDPGGMLTTAGDFDVFLVKYNAGGSLSWAKAMGGSGTDYGQSIAVDGGGNVYVTGFFNSDTVDLNPGGNNGALTTVGNYDGFLAKYDTGGSFLWAKDMGGRKADEGWGIAVDGNGNVYVTGYFNGTADFNPGGSGGTLTATGGSDGFLAKYDAGGSFLWAKDMGGNKTEEGWSIAVDGSGNAYVTGLFNSTIADFNVGGNGGTLTNAGNFDCFLAKYDAGGSFLWAKDMGGNKFDRGYGVAASKFGQIYGTGYFNNTAIFDTASGAQLTSNGTSGSTDIYLVKFACSDTSSSYLSVSTCEANYTLNDSVYMASGIYTQIFPNISGCDSTVTLDLTLTPIMKPIINIDSFALGVTGTYTTYQWIKNDVLIPGATDSTYTVTENGNYRVAVTNGKGCSDTSNVYPITNYTVVTDVHLLAQYIKAYPNPAADRVYIQSPVPVNVTLTDVAGRRIREVKNASNVSLKNMAEGMYLLRITNRKGALIKIEKIVKQKP